MHVLDDRRLFQKLDPGNALASIKLLPEQCRQSWDEASQIQFPDIYKDIENIVIAGMGGSAYGGRIVKSLYEGAEFTKRPITLANGYILPGFTSDKSLVYLSSYSGTTEETLACGQEAERIGAKISGITSGGKLAEFLNSKNYPAYIFHPTNNPSRQPRIGVGYMVMGLISLLSNLGFIPVNAHEVDDAIQFLQNEGTKLGDTISFENNPAKKLADKFQNAIPVIVVADFLEGGAHAIRNPFHETAKQFALYFTVPELDHHLMEGLKFPDVNREVLKFLFVESSLYDERNQKRLSLTREVVEKNGIQAESITLKGQTKLTQTLELIQIGAFTTFYLSMIHGVNPSSIPWVDYFKSKL